MENMSRNQSKIVPFLINSYWCSESNNGDQKWTKAQIVDNAIKYIQSFQQEQQSKKDDIENSHPNASKNLDKSFKILKKQYKRLRELLRHELVPDMPEKEFCSLDLIELQELIDKRRSEAKGPLEDNTENIVRGKMAFINYFDCLGSIRGLIDNSNYLLGCEV